MSSHDPEPTAFFLTDGGQSVDVVADRLIAFLAAARTSLDVAIYDAHFDDDHSHVSDAIVRALNDAEKRGVAVRVVFNDVDGPGLYPAAADPHEGPSAMSRVQRAVPAKGIDGRSDLMHHKYVVRDALDPARATVWTGSLNWTTSSFTRMENVVVTVPGAHVAAAYTRDFEQLWERREVEGTGTFDDQPAKLRYEGEAFQVRAFFSPGRGRAMSQVIARRIAEAKRRVRICSPVLTSTPILGTVAEVLQDGLVDTLVTVDGTQMAEVLRQWRMDDRAAWKGPLYDHIRSSGRLAEKHSTPWGSGSVHDFMHAKLVVADDWVLTGSFNCSHSGESNAENLLEIHSRSFADRCASFAELVHTTYGRS